MSKTKKKRPNPYHDPRSDTLKKTVRNRKEGCDVYVWVNNKLTTYVIDAGSHGDDGDRDMMAWWDGESFAVTSPKIKALAFWLNMPANEINAEMKSVKKEMRKILKEREKHGEEKGVIGKRVEGIVQRTRDGLVVFD